MLGPCMDQTQLYSSLALAFGIVFGEKLITDKTFCFGTKNDQVGQIKTIGHSDRLSMSCEVLLTSQHSLKWITYKFHQLRWPTVGILTGEKIC